MATPLLGGANFLSRCGQEKLRGTLSATPRVIPRTAWVTYGVVEVIRQCQMAAATSFH